MKKTIDKCENASIIRIVRFRKTEPRKDEKTMKNFEKAMANALIQAYVNAYGEEAWESKTEEEKTETLHNLLGSFLTVVKSR